MQAVRSNQTKRYEPSSAKVNYLWIGVLVGVACGVSFLVTPVVAMLLISFAILFGLKAISYLETWSHVCHKDTQGKYFYWLAWVGLDAWSFIKKRDAVGPYIKDIFGAVVWSFVGASCIWFFPEKIITESIFLAGWIGLIGFLLFLHCGLFKFLAVICNLRRWVCFLWKI